MRYEPLPSSFFAGNREELASRLPAGSMLILHANDVFPTNADAGIMEFKAYNTDPITLFSVKEFERFAFDQRNLRLFSSCIADIFKAGPASSIPKTGEFDLDPF